MFNMSIRGNVRGAITSLMSVPGATDLVVFVENGKASFAVIKEDMFKMFYTNIRETDITANYLLSKETVEFMFRGPEVSFEEQGEQLVLKCDTGVASEFRQVIVPLRHDYSFELIRETIAFIEGGVAKTLSDLGFIRQLAALCKFQKTGVVVKQGWGMIDTPMFKVCRPVPYDGDLVITERALAQFISFTKNEKDVRIGRVNRYNVCVDRYNFAFGFVRVRNNLPSFVESYQSMKPLAEYKVDAHAISESVAGINQLKTQEVSLSIDFKNGIVRIFERTKGEFISHFYSEEIKSSNDAELTGTINFNFKVMKTLLTTSINFGTCILKFYKAIVAFELSNGLIIMVKRGGN